VNHRSADSPLPSDLRAELRAKDDTKFDDATTAAAAAGLTDWWLVLTSSGDSGDGGSDVGIMSPSSFITDLSSSSSSTYTDTVVAMPLRNCSLTHPSQARRPKSRTFIHSFHFISLLATNVKRIR